MDLGKFVKENKEELVARIEYVPGFVITMEYVDRAEMESLLEQSKVIDTDPRTRQTTESYSDEKFFPLLVKKIVDWDGLTLGLLRDLMPIKVEEDDLEDEVECTEANAMVLVENVFGFNTWLRDTAIDLQTFRENQVQEQEKNLPNLQGESSARGSSLAKSA